MERKKILDYGFLTAGLLVQIAAYCWIPMTSGGEWRHPLYLISGLLGITAVILCAQGKLLMFAFGVSQIITYSILCWWQNLYSGIFINIFYFCCQCYGLWNWHRRIKGAALETSHQVPTIKLSLPAIITIVVSCLATSALVGFGLDRFTDDSQPWLDAFTTIPAIAAEIMMIMAIREHWFFWFAIDIFYVILWARAGDPCMTMQYLFWAINCVYGFAKWSKASHG